MSASARARSTMNDPVPPGLRSHDAPRSALEEAVDHPRARLALSAARLQRTFSHGPDPGAAAPRPAARPAAVAQRHLAQPPSPSAAGSASPLHLRACRSSASVEALGDSTTRGSKQERPRRSLPRGPATAGKERAVAQRLCRGDDRLGRGRTVNAPVDPRAHMMDARGFQSRRLRAGSSDAQCLEQIRRIGDFEAIAFVLATACVGSPACARNRWPSLAMLVCATCSARWVRRHEPRSRTSPRGIASR